MSKGERAWFVVALVVLSLNGSARAQDGNSDIAGTWEVRADQGDVAITTDLDLTKTGDAYAGHSGPMDTLGAYSLQFEGKSDVAGLHLRVIANGQSVGDLDLKVDGGTLRGAGDLFGTPISLSGHRSTPPPGSARTYDFDPTRFHVVTSPIPTPVLRLFPGDIVRTRTVDAYGIDEKGKRAAMPGNAGTGPFYVEGAAPGDTVGIHILSLRTNRGTARMGSGTLSGVAVTPGYTQTPAPGRSTWVLDADHGVARLETPSERLKGFTVPLSPMLGVVAVAPPAGLSVPNSDLGEWGGNLDYPEVREGVTLYLPVYQAGALIYVGDAHARQGAGEITGQGLETSMAVEFQVTLIKHESFGQPWAENADYVMVSGIGGSLNDALQRATTGLARWLKAKYQLDDSDVAAVLGTSLQYDVAEVVDPKFHVVAKIRKDTLSKINLPR